MWFVKRGERVGGPYEFAKLQAAVQKGQITASDLFSESRSGPWVTLEKINSIHGNEEQDSDEDDWMAVSPSVIQNPRPAPSSVEEVEPNRSWQISSIFTGLILGLILGLTLGFVIWGWSQPHLEVAVTTSEPVDNAPEVNSALTNTEEMGKRLGEESGLEASHGEMIKQILQNYFDTFGVSLRETYGYCIEDDQALKLLSSYNWGGLPQEPILSFSNMPSEDALRLAASSKELVLIPLKYNGADSSCWMQFVGGVWKVDYTANFIDRQGYNQEFPVTVGIQVYRKPDNFTQHEVRITVVNDSNINMVLTGKCRNPVLSQPALVQCEPHRMESDTLSFTGANSEMLRGMVLDGGFLLECDIFPAGEGVDTFQKKLFKVQFIVDEKELEKFKIACRQPHEVRKRSD